MSARYDKIGIQYDTTRRADLYVRTRLLALLQPRKAGRYIDVACGSGNYTIALANEGLDFVGADHSARMVAQAREKSSAVKWHIADARALPFADSTFDGAICTLAIHHFDNLAAAFAETRRVLHGGRLVIFTATHPQMRGYWLNEYFPLAMEDSIAQMPDLPVVTAALLDAGLSNIQTEPYTVRQDLQDLFLYSGKHRPQMYLDPRIRAGISTFSLLANPAEVIAGCERLAHDIETGAIDVVRRRYENGLGDYMFVVAQTHPEQGGEAQQHETVTPSTTIAASEPLAEPSMRISTK